ncbi:Transcription factor SOX-6 [Branchiostoma belcheri]|nr:Transcription factor SOX-6 [Branchiostoma belcheri]
MGCQRIRHGYPRLVPQEFDFQKMVFDPKSGTTEVRTFTVKGRKYPLEDNRKTIDDQKKFMRFREDHVYEEMDPDDVTERLKTPGEYEEEEDITEMLRNLNGPPRTTIELPLQDGQAYSVVVTTRARAVPMQNDLMTLSMFISVDGGGKRRTKKHHRERGKGKKSTQRSSPVQENAARLCGATGPPAANGDETSSSLLKRKRTNAHNARALNKKNAVGTYPTKPLQVGQWLAVAYKEGHYVGIVKAKFFDYRVGGQYAPTQASELVDPKYVYLVNFPTRYLMGEKTQNLALTEKVHQTTLSKVIAAQWRALSDTDKQPFYDRAAEFKRAHLVYPTYKYRPRKKPAKKLATQLQKRNKFKSGPVVMAPTVESFRARLEACPP